MVVKQIRKNAHHWWWKKCNKDHNEILFYICDTFNICRYKSNQILLNIKYIYITSTLAIAVNIEEGMENKGILMWSYLKVN